MSGLAVDLGAMPDVASPNHPLLATVTGWLADIILGDEAADLLETLDVEGADSGELDVGQVWIWREARIDVGRKARAGDGLSYRMPIRVTWAGGHLRLLHGGTLCLAAGRRQPWTARGMGWDLADESVPPADHAELLAPVLRSRRGFNHDHSLEVWPAEQPTRRTVPGPPRPALLELVEAGRVARWEFLMWLQPTVQSCLTKAHSGIRAEVGVNGALSAPLVDQVKLDQLADLMLFGDGLQKSSADRLIALCTSPGTFVKVDPLRYLTIAIRRDATTSLRRAIGDPHIGRKVRKLARELGTRDVTTVVGEYRRRWPSDHLATDRAEQALSVGSDPMATWVSVERHWSESHGRSA